MMFAASPSITDWSQAITGILLAAIAVGGVVVALFRWPHTDHIERERMKGDIQRIDEDVERLKQSDERKSGILERLRDDISDVKTVLGRLDERTKAWTHREE